MEFIIRKKRTKRKQVANFNYHSSDKPYELNITRSRVTTYCDELKHCSSCPYDNLDTQKYDYIESIGENFD